MRNAQLIAVQLTVLAVVTGNAWVWAVALTLGLVMYAADVAAIHYARRR